LILIHHFENSKHQFPREAFPWPLTFTSPPPQNWVSSLLAVFSLVWFNYQFTEFVII
jgi:hypothetical protein